MEGGGASQEPPHPVHGSGVAFPPLPILLSVEFGSISKLTKSAVRFYQLGENLGQVMHKLHAELEKFVKTVRTQHFYGLASYF